MRVVLDVNIVASAAVSPDGQPAFIFDSMLEGSNDLIASEEMVRKLAAVLDRQYFSSRLSEAQRSIFVDRCNRAALLIEPDPTIIGVADDDENDRVIGTAVAAGADVIVTGDKGLLALRQYQGIPIVSARAFLDILNL